METELATIIPDSKLKNKLLNNNNPERKEENMHDVQLNYTQSNCLSKLFFFWPRYALKKSNKGNLTQNDVCHVSHKQSIDYEIDKIKKTFLKYNTSKRYKKYSLVMTIVLTNYKLLLFLFLLDLFNVGIDYARMFFYRKIIFIFSKQDFFPKKANVNFINTIKNIKNYQFNIVEAVMFYILIRMTRTLIFNHIEFNNSKLTAKITNQMIALLTEKILISNSFYSNTSIKGEGELLNLAEVDAERIGAFFFSGPRIITAPIKVFISMYLLFKLFGFYFFYVLIILVIIIIVIVLLQVFYIKNFKKLLMLKDKRMKIVSYVFQTLKCLKLNSLDDEFIKRIKNKREDELKYIKKTLNIDLFTFIINSNINLILIIFTLCFYAYSNKELEISNLFTSFQLIHSMTFPLILIPFFFNRLFSNLISVKRLQTFLQTDEFELNKFKNIKEFSKDILVQFDNVTFGLQKNSQEINFKNRKMKKNKYSNISLDASTSPSNPSIELQDINQNKNIDRNRDRNKNKKDIILLNDIFFSLKKGEFIGVIGATGSGKSCLINAILNNYHIYSQDSIPIINGEISYSPQIPWITTDTIKNNILFYNHYDPKKYQKIISLCQLENDFENLVEKDETLINSSSTNVSGGQKARISLARCLYKDADIYLLDDPFSSIDNKVSAAIFKNSFCDYLKDKGRVLVTNDISKLSNVDKVVYMEKGSIIFTGTFEEYTQKYSSENLIPDEIMKEENDEIATDSHDNSDNSINNNLSDKINGKEDIEKNPYINKFFHSNKGNSVSCRTYLDFIKFQGGIIISIILIILIIATRAIESYRRTFIPSLTKNYKEIEAKKTKESTQDSAQLTSNLQKNLPTYLKISLIGFIINFIAEFIINFASIKCIRLIHEKMVYKLAKAPINLFHDIVPIGQIINHLTKDIEMVEGIVRQVNFFFKLIFSLISAIALCYMYNKSTLYFCPIMLISSLLLTKYYINTGRCLRRLLRISFSPIMTILNESIKGVDIIRSSHAETFTIDKMYKKLDERYGISLFAEGCQRWYNLRRGYSSQIFFCGILFYMVYYHKKYSAESIAIILQTTEDFINLLINSSMYLSQLEISMIGLERCTTLMKIDSEKNPDKDITSELKLKNWPNRGKIKIVNFSASYRPETPIILKNINIEIEPGEKIGIVGRTGSGKSSLVLSLARVIEPQTGNIFIDDENIQNINLEYLRDKLSIVAQDPFLIESNVKDNIDPLHLYEDDKILEILNDFCLFEKYGNEKLNINISENGKNLSLGQKQLISFARAVIKKNKIIILDEATSSVDTETEKIIQNNMEKYFGDSTVIIIAHHLQMVKNCKTIYVIDNGEIVESGSYSDLLKDKNSKFYSLYLKENNS